jgi:maltose alpha-D-glucosyltransferase / alpha-amylase
MPSDQTLWYKDAVFYELHVKAFQDSNGDGIGDFRGLLERLDYVQDLGVDAIWLLPFYPSPLRDDGYDIADYYGIHPSYGNLQDFERFIEEAHRRGLRVIADLVLNHTSDQHRWFQRARRAPRGSPERNYYVWSDTDESYADARIIFTDTEPSNWTWDPVAEQYYWHRFFAHQPDLNWDNPEVKEKMFEVMEFWLEKGLDGFRADAVPYLIEREGTICENLPETHDILKEFRQRLDSRYPGRVLLAEANQWPDDVRPYFGDGDEFHMAFHFPLMPRIFMAVRQGIRKPIVEIIERTPEIPEDCQWCMFLRNHDELTLEMVTDEERDYMYQEYAADTRMRLNLGIRRRLAPLMDNDRRKIELLNSILFTMPGSPIIYYGDEIAMGDNIYLGDRDGVRTPMQWSPDRNAGFSRAEAARLYQPVITDSVYGFQAINVEAQQRSPFSLLHWMKRLVQVRKQHRAFGRGSIEFLEPENPHVLAYLREFEGDVILVVNNLSGSAQAVRLDLSRFAGRTPVELLGQTAFLPVDESPYALTLSPYGFFWFGLHAPGHPGEEDRAVSIEWAEQDLGIFESPQVVAGLVSAIPHEWIAAQRWFLGKAREIASVGLADHTLLADDGVPHLLLATIRVRFAEGESEDYLLPLGFRPPAVSSEPGGPPASDSRGAEPLVTYSGEAGEIRLYEALLDRQSAGSLLAAIEQERSLVSPSGSYRGHRTPVLEERSGRRTPVRRVEGEQSNTSVVFGDQLILKVFRKLEAGVNPDLEVTRFLMEQTDFREMPRLAGWIDYRTGPGDPSTIAGLFEFVANRGEAWSYTLRALRRYLAAASRSAADPSTVAGREATRRMAGDFLASARALGSVTGRLHAALASAGPEHPDFEPEEIARADVMRWAEELQGHAGRVLGELGRRLDAIPGIFSPALLNDLAAIVRDTPNLLARIDGLRVLEGSAKSIRFHGDYHLGQLLRREDASPGADDEWVILDFEGEPARPLATRRGKHSPLRDVAGMLRSFDYAVRVALAEQPSTDAEADATLESWGAAWQREVRRIFLDAYREAVAGAGLVPGDDAVMRQALEVFELDKAIYELGYEMNSRPDWVWVPVRAIRGLMAEGS